VLLASIFSPLAFYTLGIKQNGNNNNNNASISTAQNKLSSVVLMAMIWLLVTRGNWVYNRVRWDIIDYVWLTYVPMSHKAL